MTKLEELKKARAAAWGLSHADRDVVEGTHCDFYEQAYALTPTLLEAADLLLWAFRNLDDSKHETLRDQIRDVLERLE